MHVDGLAPDTWVHTKFHNYMACELWPIVGLLQHKKKQRERERERETSSSGFASSKGSMMSICIKTRTSCSFSAKILLPEYLKQRPPYFVQKNSSDSNQVCSFCERLDFVRNVKLGHSFCSPTELNLLRHLAISSVAVAKGQSLALCNPHHPPLTWRLLSLLRIEHL